MANESIRVLLIDDYAGDARLIMQLLSPLSGFSVRYVHSDQLSGGFLHLARSDTDVVLLDLHQANDSGFDAFLHLRKTFPALPVVILTDFEDEPFELRAVRLGAQDCLPKAGLDSASLGRALRHALERNRTLDELAASDPSFARLFAEFQESIERYDLAATASRVGLWDLNLRSGEIYYSPGWKVLLGYEKGEDLSSTAQGWLERIHPDDREAVQLSLASHLSHQSQIFESQFRLQRKDGDYTWVQTNALAVADDQGIPYRIVGALLDISDSKKAEEQLLHDAFHDKLTGLPNRALFLDRLERTIEHARRKPENHFAVLFLDLDRFKIINDSLGHNIGDQLLLTISRLLQSCLRAEDTVARLGGDEFVILLEDVHDTGDVLHVVDRIQKALAAPIVIDKRQIHISTSTGIVLSTTGYETKEDVLRDADIAMYQAKIHGRAGYVIFDAGMRSQVIERLEMENDLHAALKREEFEIHYQPIVSLKEDRLAGFEALLRWRHPTRGYVPPRLFIPVAEETGLIFEIGDWVLLQACRQVRDWQRLFPTHPPLSINVNISSRQFGQPDLIQRVRRVLDETGLEPGQLNLEITENLLLENAEMVTSVLRELRSMGISIQIDDFGTGYSSFSYLQRFPIDVLKIDYSFINKMGENGDRSEIVETILVLTRQLGIQAVAEGVETQNQLEQLKALECPYGQGYYISVPTDAGAITGWFQERQTTSQEYAWPFKAGALNESFA